MTQHLEVFVWPYWGAEGKSDLVSQAISFWDEAFLPYQIMEFWHAGKSQDITQLVDMMRKDRIMLNLCEVANLPVQTGTSLNHTDHFTLNVT